MVDWSSFSWEAFATLATGLAAVIAAVVVAKRQLRIIDRQALLQELELRNALFDRRAQAYNSIRRYIGHIVYSGSAKRPDFDIYVPFHEAVESIRFLFSTRLHLEITALAKFVSDLLDHAEYASHPDLLFGSEQHQIAQADLQRRMIELRRRYDALPAMFEREMKLTTTTDSLKDYITGIGDDPLEDALRDLASDLGSRR